MTTNTPRLPAPFFVVTVITLDPLPVIRNSDTPRVRLFPFPATEALIVRVPVAFTIVENEKGLLERRALFVGRAPKKEAWFAVNFSACQKSTGVS